MWHWSPRFAMPEPPAQHFGDVDPMLCDECKTLAPTAVPAAARVGQELRAEVNTAPRRRAGSTSPDALTARISTALSCSRHTSR